MPYDATLFPVLVSGPSDVDDELGEVIAAMTAWNDRHGDRVSVRMDPRTWRSHGSPQLGGDPQEIINRQVADKCDAVIAVFGARLGTETPRAVSGTAEEIERLDAAGKRVMVYFSTGDIPRDRFSPEQFQALEAFKQQLRSKGLLGEFTSRSDLRVQLDSHMSELGYFFRDSLVGSRDRPRLSPVRTALNLEMAANYRTLERLWAEINLPLTRLDSRVASPELLAPLRLTQQEPPRWRRSVFEQQLPSVVESLRPEEIHRVDLFYDRLGQFDAHRGALKPFFSAANSFNFPSDSLRAWEKLREAAEAILVEGLPLEEAIDDPSEEDEDDGELGYLDHQVARIQAISSLVASGERYARLRDSLLEQVKKYPPLEASPDPSFFERQQAHLSGLADLVTQAAAGIAVERREVDQAFERLVVASLGVLEKQPFENREALVAAWGDSPDLNGARELIDRQLVSAREQRDSFAAIKGVGKNLDRAIRRWERTFDEYVESYQAKRAVMDSIERAYAERLSRLPLATD